MLRRKLRKIAAVEKVIVSNRITRRAMIQGLIGGAVLGESLGNANVRNADRELELLQAGYGSFVDVVAERTRLDNFLPDGLTAVADDEHRLRSLFNVKSDNTEPGVRRLKYQLTNPGTVAVNGLSTAVYASVTERQEASRASYWLRIGAFFMRNATDPDQDFSLFSFSERGAMPSNSSLTARQITELPAHFISDARFASRTGWDVWSDDSVLDCFPGAVWRAEKAFEEPTRTVSVTVESNGWLEYAEIGDIR